MTIASLRRSRADFDVVIAGSGFGGSFMALRLAKAGYRVLVLERGAMWPPGSFPRSPHEIDEAFWDPDKGRLGLFEVLSFRKVGAVVSSGLGGGSLIYANVLLRKDEDTFLEGEGPAATPWPVSRADLSLYYEEAEVALGGQRFPSELGQRVPKYAAFRAAARATGHDFVDPLLAVSFRGIGPTSPANPGAPIFERLPNLHGVPRSTCRLCGECVLGCNTGSKNTLDLTVLTQAQAQGAQLRTLCEVTDFTVIGGPEVAGEGSRRTRFMVRYTDRRCGRPKSRVVTARVFVLAMGTFGTTSLLLRKRGQIGLSPAVGRGFSSNGDLLGLVFNTMTEEGEPQTIEATRGPTVTGALRVRLSAGELETDRHYGVHYVEDAGYPATIAWIAQKLASAPTLPARALQVLGAYLRARVGLDDRRLSDEIARLLGQPSFSQSALPLLGMGRDVADGTMTWANNRLHLDWDPRRSGVVHDAIRDTMARIADDLGGTYRDAPARLLGRALTVHPLGGCRMADSPEAGVTDAYGEVFGVPGLVVADGSVLPGSVGPNPALTIAAVALRNADRLVERLRGKAC